MFNHHSDLSKFCAFFGSELRFDSFLSFSLEFQTMANPHECVTIDANDKILKIKQILQHEKHTFNQYQMTKPIKTTASTSPDSDADPIITSQCREKICSWSYDIVDALNLDRSIVYSAMMLTERYLMMATQHKRSKVNEAAVEHTSAAALYLMIRHRRLSKKHRQKQYVLSVASFVVLIRQIKSNSRNSTACFLREDCIERLVSHMKRSVSMSSWKVCCMTPSPSEFVNLLSMCLTSSRQTSENENMIEKAVYLAELSVCDVYFVGMKASSIALNALVCALREVKQRHQKHQSDGEENDVCLEYGSIFDSPECQINEMMQDRLNAIYRRSADFKSEVEEHRGRGEVSFPRVVSNEEMNE